MKKKMIFAIATLCAALFVLAACNNDTTSDNGQGDPPYVDAGQDAVIDWSLFPIIIDGQRGVAANWFTAEGEDFPTHIPLVPVAVALGVTVNVDDAFPPQVAMQGLRGAISFTVGSYSFDVADSTIDLWQPSLLVDGDIYVPIAFFRDVYGMGTAAWMGGHVHLNTVADDMY